MIDWWQIKNTIDLGEVLSTLGIRVTRTERDEHFASCPLSSHVGTDANPSFSINEEKLIYHCFSCNGSGNLVDLVMDLESLSRSGAIDWLVGFCSAIASEEDTLFVDQIEALLFPNMERMSKPPLPWFNHERVEEWAKNHTNLLEQKWGIGDEARKFFQFGFDPDHSRGKYVGPALILPHFVHGQCVGWQERWLSDDRPKWVGKYTNTSDFPKKETLFNMDNLDNEVVVVESVMTVARLHQLGVSAVATFGAAVTKEQWRLLAGVDKVLLSFDNDPPGYKALDEGVRHLHSLTDVWTVPTPPTQGSDLADLSDSEIMEYLSRAEPGVLQLMESE